ncbi:MAG: hypothetical protein WAL46_07170 [Nitrososphaeraceae archaeon]
MSAEPTRLTDDDRRKLTHIPDSVETRDVLENLLFDLFIRGILTDDKLRQNHSELIGKRYIQSKGPDDLESLK